MAAESAKPEDPWSWSMRWNARMARSAIVHFVHSALILLLTRLAPDPESAWLTGAWCVGVFFSGLALLLLLRVGSYVGTTEEEIGRLIRGCYWVATTLYLSLLVISLYFITHA